MKDPFDRCLALGCQVETVGDCFCAAHWRTLTADEAQAILATLQDVHAFHRVVVEIRERLTALRCAATRSLARGVGFVILHCVRPIGHEGDHDFASA
jgi:hypothetical protein